MDELIEMFNARIRITPGCWWWTGTLSHPSSSLRYGKMKFKGRQLKAHRISYEIYFGPIRDGMFICHKCDNPSCVNPDHLFEGTHQDNMDDKVAKGRQAAGVKLTQNRNSAAGERHGRAILTEHDVLEIRRIAATQHRFGRAALAAKYGVSESTIKSIKSRKLWKHI